LRNVVAACASTNLRSISPTALGASATGSGREPPRCLDKTRQGASSDFAVSQGEQADRSSNYVPPNLTAQCNQPRKFCQGKIRGGSTKSCCFVSNSSTPSGRVPTRHNLEKPTRTRNFRKSLSETITHPSTFRTADMFDQKLDKFKIRAGSMPAIGSGSSGQSTAA
jgi:hypothetical protein